MGKDVESELPRLIRSQAFERAAMLTLETYGGELFGFLVNVLGETNAAEEVFAQVSEDLWRGLPKFASRSSVRTWLYTLAQHAAARFRRSPWNQAMRRTGSDALDAVIAEVRSRTKPWLQTDVKDRWRKLRESLDEGDRALLVLRVDRGLSWDDIARVMLDDAAADPAALTREASRLRKRFQLLKEELRRRATAEGLLSEAS